MNNLYFFLIAMGGMYFGRKIGWFFSKMILYNIIVPTWLVVFLCTIWGTSIAYLIHLTTHWQHPHIIIKIIFGYALGGYVAFPNYGLWKKNTLPPEMLNRNNVINAVSAISYLVSILLFELFL
jgi:hypothetical protein